MATPLPFIAPAAAPPPVTPAARTRSDLMAYLLDQTKPDDMVANPPQSFGEGLARTAGVGLDALMAKKVVGQQNADKQQKLNDFADLLEGINPELAAAARKGVGLDVANQVLGAHYAPKVAEQPSSVQEYQWAAANGQLPLEAGKPIDYLQFMSRKGAAPPSPPTPYTDPAKIAADERNGYLSPEDAASARAALGTPEGIDFGDVGMLRKEIQALPSYKNVTQAMPIYRSMVKTAPNKTRASDLNLVYGLGKIMDPTSVVREGEMIMVKDTASLPDWFLGEIARINGGNALQEDTRNAILTEAQTRMAAYLEAWGLDAEQYKGIAARNGIPEVDVLPDIGDMPEFVPLGSQGGPRNPAPATEPDPAEVEAEMRRRGLIK